MRKSYANHVDWCRVYNPIIAKLLLPIIVLKYFRKWPNKKGGKANLEEPRYVKVRKPYAFEFNNAMKSAYMVSFHFITNVEREIYCIWF